MSDLVLAAKIASRFKRAAAHYPIDPAKVKSELTRLNDPEPIRNLAEHYGGAYEYTYEVIPLSAITIPDVWKPSKLPPLLVKMQAGEPLDPVRLGDSQGYFVEDGIHRTNLSRQLGFTHVPAIVSRWRQMIRGPMPELPVIPTDSWVVLKMPFHDGDQIYQYGWLVEHVGFQYEMGRRRHLYTVARVNQHSDKPDFARMRDDQFMLAPEPSWGEMVKDRVT